MACWRFPTVPGPGLARQARAATRSCGQRGSSGCDASSMSDIQGSPTYVDPDSPERQIPEDEAPYHHPED
jgi:hypothetical protein